MKETRESSQLTLKELLQAAKTELLDAAADWDQSHEENEAPVDHKDMEKLVRKFLENLEFLKHIVGNSPSLIAYVERCGFSTRHLHVYKSYNLIEYSERDSVVIYSGDVGFRDDFHVEEPNYGSLWSDLQSNRPNRRKAISTFCKFTKLDLFKRLWALAEHPEKSL